MAYWCRPKTAASLAEALLNLIKIRPNRENFGGRGLAFVQERYSLEQMAAATEKVYASIM